MSCLLGGSMVGLMAASSKREGLCHMPHVPGLLHAEPLSLWQATADPCLCSSHSKSGLAQSLWDIWVLVHTRFCLNRPRSLVGYTGASPLPLDVGYFCCCCCWDPTFSCRWLYSNNMQFWSSLGSRWVNVLLLHHLVCILEMCCKYHFKLKEKNIKA